MTALSHNTVIDVEFELLLSCLRGGPVELPAHLDWGRFLDLCSRHRVQNMVYKPLLAQHMDMPETAVAFFEHFKMANVRKYLAHIHVIGLLTNLFKQQAIDFVILKGISLATAYPTSTDRHVGDLDILIIHENQFWQAVELLRANGFTLPGLPARSFGEAEKEFLLSRVKDLTFEHNTLPVSVELHARLFSGKNMFPYDNQAIWESRTELVHSDVSTYVMGPELLLEYCIIHGGMTGWFRLKWLLDVHLLKAISPTEHQKQDFTDPRFTAHNRVYCQTARLQQKFFHRQEQPRFRTSWIDKALCQMATRLAIRFIHQEEYTSAQSARVLVKLERTLGRNLYRSLLLKDWPSKFSALFSRGVSEKELENLAGSPASRAFAIIGDFWERLRGK